MHDNNQHPETDATVQATPIEEALNQLALFAELTANGNITIEGFQDFIRNVVRPILPHQKLLCGCGQVLVDQLHVKYMFGVDYSDGNIAQIKSDFSLAERPVVANWLHTREPVFIHTERDQHLLSPLEKAMSALTVEMDYF